MSLSISFLPHTQRSPSFEIQQCVLAKAKLATFYISVEGPGTIQGHMEIAERVVKVMVEALSKLLATGGDFRAL